MSAPPPRPGASGATPPPRPIAGSSGGHPQAVGRLAPSRPTQSIRSPSAQATNAPITRRWFLWGGLAAVALLIGGVVGFAIGSSGASPAGAPTLSPTTPPTKTPISSSQPSVTPLPSAEPSQEPVDAVDRARRALDDVPVVDGRSDTRYFRDAFGEAWYDVDGNGCRTRDDILGRDLADPVFKPGTNDCRVLSGVLTDPYSGVVRDFVFGYETSQLVPVDHVVALAWAWHHGAEAWTPERRVQFANDPINLVATTKEMNEEKLAHGPSEWLPPLESGRCEYIVHWVDVLDAYDLGVNVADKATAERVLKDC